MQILYVSIFILVILHKIIKTKSLKDFYKFSLEKDIESIKKTAYINIFSDYLLNLSIFLILIVSLIKLGL